MDGLIISARIVIGKSSKNSMHRIHEFMTEKKINPDESLLIHRSK